MMKNSKWTVPFLAVMASVLLASCGSGGIGGGGPSGPPEPTATFIPEAGALVGSGNGTATGTVRISPNATEVEMMNLVNEVRTKGTLNGEDAIAGSCVEGTFKPGTLRPLTFDGILAYSARMHATYMTESGDYDHVEHHPEHPAFYGATGKDRNERARAMFGQAWDGKAVYENIVIQRPTAARAMRDFMLSSGHCQSIMRPEARRVAIGYTPAYDDKVDSWVQKFSN